MPRLTIEVTEEDQRMMTAVSKSKQTFRSDLASGWYRTRLKTEYNRLPQSVLDNLASDKNE